MPPIPSSRALPFPVLIADIGGSNSRYALVGPDGRPDRMQVIDNDECPDLQSAIGRYLGKVGVRPDMAVLAVAGPATDEEVYLTNRPSWRFRREVLAQDCGLGQVHVLNDFEALAWAVPRLGDGDTHVVGAVRPGTAGPKVVLGPGTGLGAAALIPQAEHWQVVATESGHASFGPRHADEFQIFQRMRAKHGGISVEDVLSGGGLERLAAALEQGKPLSSETIVAHALAGEAHALMAVRLFVRLLGRFAGDLALIFKATGGVYLAGGVGRGIKQLLDEPAFRTAFEDHPPYGDLLAHIPTMLITYGEPGLLGCAAVAERLARQSL